jgi:hypothetical protein
MTCLLLPGAWVPRIMPKFIGISALTNKLQYNLWPQIPGVDFIVLFFFCFTQTG